MVMIFMNRRILTILALAIFALGCRAVNAQSVASAAPIISDKKIKAAPTPQSGSGSNQSGQVTLKLDRGGSVVLSNRTGDIVITGWDRDTVEAKATSDSNNSEILPIQVSREPVGSKILLSVPSVAGRNYGGDIRLDVKLPRYANIESISSLRGNIAITGLEGAVSINSGSGDVVINGVGSLRVNRRNGDITAKGVNGDFIARATHSSVTAENISGRADVVTTHGNVRVRDAKGDLRAYASTGNIQAHCVKGRADINSTSGSITMVGVGGDVEANTTSGDVIFRGIIRADGRYRLKTLSGEAVMTIQPDAPGFTATLLTYSGELETAFPLKIDGPLQGGINRRITGVYGDGQAKITLDSFSGGVRIIKGARGALNNCK